MTRQEVEFVVSPQNILKDLAVIGCQVRADGENLLISGLQTAEERGMINQDMKVLVKETLRANKKELLDYLEMSKPS
jgi:hypothetical protein